MENKYCPILLNMFRGITTDEHGQCILQRCEWFGHGCPAYPDKAAADKRLPEGKLAQQS